VRDVMRAISSHKMRALVMSFALGAVGTAAADPTADAALVHLERGVAAFRAGDFARAHRELLVAHELAPDRPNPYRWLALTEIQLGDCARALVDIEGFLTRVDAADPRVPEMTRWRELCARTGGLRVESTPPNVSLRIDGAMVGSTPYQSLSMRAGTHTLHAESPGYRPAERSVVVEPGRSIEVHLALPAAPTPLRKRGWFWPVVGGVALTITGGIVYAATRDSDPVLPPITCDPTGCAP